MRKKILQIVLLLAALFQLQAYAQNTRVSGKITGSDNQPVVGASVTVSGTTLGTVTDADGNFSILAPSNASLLINSIGFADQTVQVDGRSVVNVTLSTGQSAGLEEVVVTGYTAQKKKDIVGSVAIVDVKALKAVPSGSALQALQGQAAGVDIINTGSPGASSTILIRGVSNFGTAAPLVLIDGVQGNINDVPANDVESIQVLKDAGAASIYGTRAANGVIIITTKRGKSGVPVVSYDSYYNLQIPHKGSDLNVLSPAEYLLLLKQVNPGSGIFDQATGQPYDFFYREGVTGPRGGAFAGDPLVDPAKYRFDPQNPNNNYIISKVVKDGTNSMYDALFSPALMMNHNVSASGGTDRANYSLSLGYLDHQGTLINTALKRYNVRINTTFKLTNSIRLGENLNIFYKSNPSFSFNGAFGPIQTAFNNLPILSLYDIGGNFNGDFAGPGNNDLGDWGNALADASLTNNNRDRTYGMVGNAFLEVDFLKNFTARTSIGGSVDNFYSQKFEYPAYWRRTGGDNEERLTERAGFGSTLQWTNTLNYKNNFGDHSLNVLVGSESIEQKGRLMNNVGTGFYSTDYEYLVLYNATTIAPIDPGVVSPGTYSNALFSLFGRIDYNFKEKYLIGATVRKDGYSAFGPDKKYGYFPSVAVGWRISKESFMQNVTFFDDLKLRASYGILGARENIPASNAYNTYNQNRGFSWYDIAAANGLVQGFFPAQYGNTFTSWERDKMFNIGLDATILNNKLDVSVEYYKKRIDGLLRQITAPATAGEGRTPLLNVGDIENKGVDIAVNYRGTVSRKVTYNVGVNFTTYKNKILSLPDPGYFDEGNTRQEEGYPISSIWGYKVIGVIQDAKDSADSPVQQDKAPGRYKYFDADGNDTINDKDRVHFGDPNPKFTLGVNLGVNVGNFDFSAQIYTSQGNDIYNGGFEYIGGFDRGAGNKSRVLLNAWTPTNTNTNVRKNETTRNFSNSSVFNSAWLEDGSFVRLRSLIAGYTFAPGGLKKIGLSRLRVYLQGNNLVTLTSYSGLDPEVRFNGINQRGIDAGSYVTEKGVVFGLNLTF